MVEIYKFTDDGMTQYMAVWEGDQGWYLGAAETGWICWGPDGEGWDCASEKVRRHKAVRVRTVSWETFDSAMKNLPDSIPSLVGAPEPAPEPALAPPGPEEAIYAAALEKHQAEAELMAAIQEERSDRAWVDAALARRGCTIEG